jgi:hypothetical protein
MNAKEIKLAIETAYLAGFNASGEGYNGEYPFEHRNPEDDAYWVEKRNQAINAMQQCIPALNKALNQ